MNVPGEIALDTRMMTLHWPDGRVQTIAHDVLRDACPCSTCRRLRGAARELPGSPNAHAAVSITDIRPMGYGVQLVFSDGHDRGIFPWPYLAAISSDTPLTA